MPFDAAGFNVGLTAEQLSDLRIIRNAREQIARDEQWCQGRLTDGVHQRCAIGWLIHAAYQEEDGGTLKWGQSDRSRVRVNHIAETYFNPAIPRRFPKTISRYKDRAVIWYNDLRRTRQSQMVALFDQVIQNLENQNAV